MIYLLIFYSVFGIAGAVLGYKMWNKIDAKKRSKGWISYLTSRKRKDIPLPVFTISGFILAVIVVYSLVCALKIDFMTFSSVSNLYGSTGSHTTTCVACHGKGKVEQWYTNDPAEKPHWETCQLCKGKGYY